MWRKKASSICVRDGLAAAVRPARGRRGVPVAVRPRRCGRRSELLVDTLVNGATHRRRDETEGWQGPCPSSSAVAGCPTTREMQRNCDLSGGMANYDSVTV